MLPYLRQLRAGGLEVSLLTFEPNARTSWSAVEVEAWRQRLDGDGIRWSMLPYHKRPSVPATIYDVIVGSRFAAGMIRREGIDVLHARGHVAAAIGALAKRSAGGKLLFDIRGFMPEEYVDAGAWPKGGWLYRLVKRAELGLMNASDGFVVLTERARELLFPGCEARDERGRPLAVIPCCVDAERFSATEAVSRDEVRRELGVEGRRVITYVGALGGWYLTAEMASLLATAYRRDPRTFALVLTQSDPALIAAPLRELGLPESSFLIRKVPSSEIPRYLKAADLAISFIKPCFSKLSSSPTKLAEYLAAGLPVICNTGIGDVDPIIARHRVGVSISGFAEPQLLAALGAAEELLADENVHDRCRRCSREEFDLHAVGGRRYRDIYERLRGGAPTAVGGVA